MQRINGHIILALILVSLNACSISKLAKTGAYKEVSALVFDSLILQTNVNIIDVRTKSEYSKSHIKGAQNASYLSGKFSTIISNLNLDTTNLTLIYCETQHRSLFAAKKLARLGFKKIVDLDRGMMYWRKQGFASQSQETSKN